MIDCQLIIYFLLLCFHNRKLAGKTVYITGASRGIGEKIGLKCAKDGANVSFSNYSRLGMSQPVLFLVVICIFVLFSFLAKHNSKYLQNLQIRNHDKLQAFWLLANLCNYVLVKVELCVVYTNVS